MENETKMQQFLLLAKSAKGLALVDLIAKACGEPGLYSFGEILSLSNVQEVGCEVLKPAMRYAREGTCALVVVLVDGLLPRSSRHTTDLFVHFPRSLLLCVAGAKYPRQDHVTAAPLCLRLVAPIQRCLAV